MMQDIENQVVICSGGLDSNQNWLELSRESPGVATQLVNFEPSLYGGYRRINGFQPLESNETEVDSAGAEGKILGTIIYNNEAIAARKQQSGATYELYRWDVGSGWVKYTTGLTLSSTGVDKIRYDTFNFDGTEKLIFVDGVNKAVVFDGTNWTQIDSAGTGNDFANAGGAQAIDAPKYVRVFENHIFLAGDSSETGVIAHSAPLAEYDWTSASGAGQLQAGFETVQIRPFREECFVFGLSRIRKISVDSSGNFVINDVTFDIGCVASDSVLEIGGDLVFLSQDGFRPIGATERNNDYELSSLSKAIQQDLISLISLNESSNIDGTIIRGKSQLRFFFSSSSTNEAGAKGIIGGIKASGDGVRWEWGELQGIKLSCVTSGFIDGEEYVIHGTYDGKVFRQEQGSSFNGSNILAIYSTPYLDLGDPTVRKTMRKIHLFTLPEGDVSIRTALDYDWGLSGRINPSTYFSESLNSGAIYGEAVYGTGEYGGSSVPIMVSNVQGSGFSNRLTISTDDTNSPYTIQGIIYEFSVDGKK